MTLTLDQADDVATRTLAAIDGLEQSLAGRTIVTPEWLTYPPHLWAADRERVASDLDGLRACYAYVGPSATPRHLAALTWLGEHADRYSEALLRTARLYRVTS